MAALNVRLDEARITGCIVFIPHPHFHRGQAVRSANESKESHRSASIFQLCTSKHAAAPSALTAAQLAEFSQLCAAFMYAEEDRLCDARYCADHVGYPDIRPGFPVPPSIAENSLLRLDAQGNFLNRGPLTVPGMTFAGPGTISPFRWETEGPFRLGEVALEDWHLKSLSVYVGPGSVIKGVAVVVVTFDLDGGKFGVVVGAPKV